MLTSVMPSRSCPGIVCSVSGPQLFENATSSSSDSVLVPEAEHHVAGEGFLDQRAMVGGQGLREVEPDDLRAHDRTQRANLSPSTAPAASC